MYQRLFGRRSGGRGLITHLNLMIGLKIPAAETSCLTPLNGSLLYLTLEEAFGQNSELYETKTKSLLLVMK
jgi:hypothetical protein